MIPKSMFFLFYHLDLGIVRKECLSKWIRAALHKGRPFENCSWPSAGTESLHECNSSHYFLYWEALALKTNVNCTQNSVLSEVIDFLSGTSPLSQTHYNSLGNGRGPRTTLWAALDSKQRHNCSELGGSPLAKERFWASLELECVRLYALPLRHLWHRYPLQQSKRLPYRSSIFPASGERNGSEIQTESWLNPWHFVELWHERKSRVSGRTVRASVIRMGCGKSATMRLIAEAWNLDHFGLNDKRLYLESCCEWCPVLSTAWHTELDRWHLYY